MRSHAKALSERRFGESASHGAVAFIHNSLGFFLVAHKFRVTFMDVKFVTSVNSICFV